MGPDKDTGWFEVDWDPEGEIIIRHPNPNPDPEAEEDDSRSYAPLTPAQARNLARDLLRFAEERSPEDEKKRTWVGRTEPLKVSSEEFERLQEDEDKLKQVLLTTCEAGALKVMHEDTFAPGDLGGLPDEPSYLLLVEVPITCHGITSGDRPFSPSRYRQAVRILVGLWSGMWGVSESTHSPIITLRKPPFSP